MKCPVCNSSTTKEFRPFCSRRCADIDLGRWFNEDYRIPTEDEPDGETVEEPDESRGALAH